MFLLFFHYLNNKLYFMFFFYVFLTAFYVSTKVSSTQPPHLHP